MSHEVTQILDAAARGDPAASEQLLPLVYAELRKLAASWLSRQRGGETLQPTALVHEAFLRLVGGRQGANWDSRGHFFAAAAVAMRRILVESARRRKALKRGGGRQRIDLQEVAAGEPPDAVDLVELDEALAKLAALDERKARLVELRFFAGLTMEESAAALGVSTVTAYRDWAYARAWLHREIAGDSDTRCNG